MGRFNGFGESHALPAVQRNPSLLDVTAQRSLHAGQQEGEPVRT